VAELGDSFSRHPKYGAPVKGLLLAPERLLLALAQDGWIVRTKMIWAKSNLMPSSVTDRLSLTYEVIYFLARQKSYFFDLDAIREPHRSSGAKQARVLQQQPPIGAGPLAATRGGLRRTRPVGEPGHPLGKNPGDVWPIATKGSRSPTFSPSPARPCGTATRMPPPPAAGFVAANGGSTYREWAGRKSVPSTSSVIRSRAGSPSSIR
jgi:site-specific DNA-methyltransferase (adenine-specific)